MISAVHQHIASTIRMHHGPDPIAFTVVFIGLIRRQTLRCVVCIISIKRAVHHPDIFESFYLFNDLVGIRPTTFMRTIIDDSNFSLNGPGQCR